MTKEKNMLSRFARTERAAPPNEADVAAAQKAGVAICPCGTEGVDYRCVNCGATRHINSVSGNLTWMRNGRIAAAFHDERAAYIEMANEHGIPRERWPEQFRN